MTAARGHPTLSSLSSRLRRRAVVVPTSPRNRAIEQSSFPPAHASSYFPDKQMTYLNVNDDGYRAFDDADVGWFHFTVYQNCESFWAACELSFAGRVGRNSSVLGDARRI